jgi:hypothetical protein
MLKSRNALLESDVRFRNMAGDANPDGSIRWMSIDDLHELVAPIELRPEVPAAVHVQFDKARHAFIYSWFAYDLVSLAEQQGYQALEFALRLRLPADEQRKAQEKRWTLDTLIKRAFAHGWLDRADFEVEGPYGRSGTLCILDMLPHFRNELAHGSENLFPAGSHEMLKLCADILNMLFDPKHEVKPR